MRHVLSLRSGNSSCCYYCRKVSLHKGKREWTHCPVGGKRALNCSVSPPAGQRCLTTFLLPLFPSFPSSWLGFHIPRSNQSMDIYINEAPI